MDKETKGILNNILTKVVDIDHRIKVDMVTNQKFDQYRSEIYSHIDGFVKLYETLDQELVSLRHKYDRPEERLTKVEQSVL